MRKFYLIRHGKPVYPNGERTCLGNKVDVPLSPEGLRQAEETARAFETVALEAVYTSPLLRARQTGALLAPEAPHIVLPELGEMDGGEWDGRPFSELRRAYPEFFADQLPDVPLTPPGGETDAHAERRGFDALESIAAETTGSVAVVAHAGLFRVLLYAIARLPAGSEKRFAQPYACINTLTRDADGWHILAADETAEDFLCQQRG